MPAQTDRSGGLIRSPAASRLKSYQIVIVRGSRAEIRAMSAAEEISSAFENGAERENVQYHDIDPTAEIERLTGAPARSFIDFVRDHLGGEQRRAPRRTQGYRRRRKGPDPFRQ